jgi:Winged helix DNA-binding domain
VGERVLSVRELNRALLARQLLLEPADLSPALAVELVCGLQTQHAPSGYVGLWARTRAQRAGLTTALNRAIVVQGWVMRCAIHMVSAADYAPFTAAVRAARRAFWLRTEKRAAGLDMMVVADAVRRHLADGPRTQPELAALLAADGFAKMAWVARSYGWTWPSRRRHLAGHRDREHPWRLSATRTSVIGRPVNEALARRMRESATLAESIPPILADSRDDLRLLSISQGVGVQRALSARSSAS